MFIYVTYALLAYLGWWVLSRVALMGAWLYSKPGSLKIQHYILIGLSVVPGVFEILSTLFVILSTAFGGIDPKKVTPETEPGPMRPKGYENAIDADDLIND